MAFGGFDQNKNSHPMAEINMVPLIDVMLVLLIIFMITAPMMTHAVKIDLPKASSVPQQPGDDPVAVSVDRDGQLFWNQEQIDRAVLNQRLAEIAQSPQQPELHIRADQNVPYHFVAETLADAAKAGVSKIGFVSDPDKN